MSIPSFYNKISEITRNELIDFLIHNQTELTVKIDNQYLKTRILSKKNDKNFKVKKPIDREFSNTPFTCLFQIKEDRYFFKSFVSTTTSECLIEIPSEIFHLQRRNNYRVSMPIGTYYICEIIYLNNKKTKIKAEIRDLSLGGCQISFAGKESDFSLKENDELDLYLKLDKFEFQKLSLIVKRSKYIDSQNSFLVGTEYYDPDSETVSELQSLLLHLDRIHRGKAED